MKTPLEEALELIEYMHQLTVIPDNVFEDYSNRYLNTVDLLKNEIEKQKLNSD